METNKVIKKKKATVLIILDGYGITEKKEGNAIAAAKTPFFDKYNLNHPYTLLFACGEYVGLPDGQMGNSEVGHMTIGSGRIVDQELKRINADIANGTFSDKEQFLEAIKHCKTHGSNLHVMILASHGGVHSEINHLYELLKLFAKHQVNVYIHCFMDGRDVDRKSGRDTIRELEQKIQETGCGHIATVQGRYYVMDRDNNFDRIQKGYDAIVRLKGHQFATAAEAVEKSYEQQGEKASDEFIEPCIIKGAKGISDNDAVVFCNFRPDRAKSIMKMLIYSQDELSKWYSYANTKKAEQAKADGKEYKNMPEPDVKDRPKGLYIVAMSDYDDSIDERMHIAYKKQIIHMTLGEYISNLGLRQLRIAETEKYAHVTRFFSGNREAEFDGEKRHLIPSPRVRTYDLKPEMSAYEVCDRCIEYIKSGEYDLIVINFANPDMVGHTGKFDAAVKAIEAVDSCLGNLVETTLNEGGTAVITADHGNADEMEIKYTDEKGEEQTRVSTEHSKNPVPFIIVSERDDLSKAKIKLREGGGLCDIAPTILDIMGLEKPVEFTGQSLILRQ